MFFNSGALVINYGEPGVLYYQLPRAPVNYDDLITMLNSPTFKDTNGATVLSSIFTFSHFDNRISVENIDAGDMWIDAIGNM